MKFNSIFFGQYLESEQMKKSLNPAFYVGWKELLEYFEAEVVKEVDGGIGFHGIDEI